MSFLSTRLVRLASAALLLAICAAAQTIQQAQALWKAHRWADANEVFKALHSRNPKDPDLKVMWGRFFMDHNQEKEANDLFIEALAINKEQPGALLGLAILASENYEAKAADLAKRALAADPKLLEAQELVARLALEDNNNAKATEEAQKALAINPNSVQAKAILAAMDLLADKKDSQWDPHDARGYETIAHFFTLNRRYDEGIAYYEKAIQMDPELYSARSQLGMNLMRMGRPVEARQQLQICYDNQFRDHYTNDTLTLLDSYKNFVTYKSPTTIVTLHKKEADLLKPYIESEAQKCIRTYEAKYKFKLEKPVQVEVYPDHADFAVRTLGMPNIGALGVTFNYAVALDSPSARRPGDFHWGTTLWHEMSHVFTLNMTGSRVPRWFTEGVAVHEETAVSSEWGDRLGPDEIMAIKEKKLLPVAELDRGFIHPTAPQQVVISYFQGGRIVDFITDKWGWDTVLAMLKDFGAGSDTPSVIRKELKLEPEEFDKQFLAKLEADTKNVVDHFKDWKDQMKVVGDASKKQDWDAVIKSGTTIRDWYPDYVEDHNVYEMLAQAYEAKGDKASATAELERYMKAGGRSPAILKKLAKQLEDASKKKEAAAALERLNFIYPNDSELHQHLGALYLELSNGPGAIRELTAVVAFKPMDPAKAHYDLARAYRMNNEPEKAKDELLAALESAPGYRQAQKMLLELSAESK
jgi:predicted Zn-dependent protease